MFLCDVIKEGDNNSQVTFPLSKCRHTLKALRWVSIDLVFQSCSSRNDFCEFCGDGCLAGSATYDSINICLRRFSHLQMLPEIQDSVYKSQSTINEKML